MERGFIMVNPDKAGQRKFFILLGIIFLTFLWMGCSNLNSNDSEPEEITPPPIEEPPRIEEFSIGAVGDIMVHEPQIKAAYVGGDQGYDFAPVFQPIKKYIEEVDIAIANLETTLSGAEQNYSGYPMFNSPEQMAEALKLTGFDVITTANNHSLD